MSNNLDLDQLAASQNNPEITVNDANGQLDAAVTVQADIAIDNTNARTLTNTELRRNVLFHITDDAPAPTAAITLTLPAVSRGLFAVLNLTSFPVTVTISGQAVTAPVVQNGATTPSFLTTDGVNVRSSFGAAGGNAPVKITFNDTGNVVASSSTVGFDLTGFMNNGYSRRITMTETGGVSTGTYDLRFYSKDTKLAADLLYSFDNIDSTANSRIFTDRLMVGFEDEDATNELHMEIDNNDGAQSMTFTVDIIGMNLTP